MWTRTVRVDVSEVIAAPPDRVWSLLGSPAALSARPGGFSVDVPVTSDAGRPLRFYLHADRAGVQVGLLEVAELSSDRLLRLQALGGRLSWELSVAPSRRGSRVRLATSSAIEPSREAHFQTIERRALRSWARNLCAICTGDRPWPDGSMPEAVREACLLDRPAPDGLEVTAQALIDRPADTVWRVFTAPPVVYAVSPGLLHYGALPGSPASGTGRVTYRISRPADQLRASATVVTARQAETLVSHSLKSPYNRAKFRVQPDGTASTLQLEYRCCNKPLVETVAEHRAIHEEQVQRLVLAYKTAIEQATPPPPVS